MCVVGRGEGSLGSLTSIGKGGIGHGGGDGKRKIKTKEGCVFERVMGDLEF